jgi:acyl-CoA hydrolase
MKKFILSLICCLSLATYAVSVDTKPHMEHSTSFVAFPQDCNANPPMVFGGKLLSEMDRCAGITTRRFLFASPVGAKDAVTIAINNVKFHKSAEVKDLLIVTGKVIKVGEKSITIKVTIEKEMADGLELVIEGEFVFCAYDLTQKKAIPHGIILEEGK